MAALAQALPFVSPEDRADDFAFVEHWLDVWAKHERDPDLGLDAPHASAGFQGGGFWGYANPLEDWAREADARAVDIIQATLDSMPLPEAAAVRHVKMHTLYPFTAALLEGSYQRAKMKIGIKLRAADFS